MRKLSGLLIGVMAATLALTGCAFSDPRIAGTPVAPATDPGLTAQAEAAGQTHTAWRAVAGLAAADPATPKWAVMADTLAAQWRVLSGPDALHRVSAVAADIGEPAAVEDADEALTTADDALRAVREANLDRAGQASGLAAVFWASLAAGAEQVRLGLRSDYGTATEADAGATIATTDPDTAWSELACRYDEGIFALRSALGFLDADDSAGEVIASAVAALRHDKASLGSASTAPPGCPGIYELPPGRDRAASLNLLATTQQSLVEATAVWLASVDDPASAVGYLMTNATLASPLGLGQAVWPGWPDR